MRHNTDFKHIEINLILTAACCVSEKPESHESKSSSGGGVGRRGEQQQCCMNTKLSPNSLHILQFLSSILNCCKLHVYNSSAVSK